MHKKVVSVSLWGNDPRYIQGAVKKGSSATAAGAAGVNLLSKEVTGGYSGKTVMVSCMGMGYKNLAKKVT